MHKSKGREFDNVYMMLNNVSLADDADKRKVYVGITRAKGLLHIHYFGDQFDKYADAALAAEVDLSVYPKPAELVLQLSHRDVYLDFFKDEDRKRLILTELQSGFHLTVRGSRLCARLQDKLLPILQFSVDCQKKIKKIEEEGYSPYDAKIRFICAWKGKEDTDETAVVLPDLYFRANEKED